METIGTSLKTIFAKFQQVKKDTGEVNKDFSQTINTLEKFGVKTGAMAGQLRPVGEILQELASKWNDMNDKQRAMVSSSLGVYQISRFSALMQGLAKDVNGVSRSQQIYSEVVKANGETNKQYETYLNSLSGAIDKFKAKWEVMFNNSMSSNGLKSIVNVGTGILNVIDKIGGLRFALISLNTILLLSSKNFRTWVSSFTNISSLKNFTTQMTLLPHLFKITSASAGTTATKMIWLGRTFDIAKIKAMTLQAVLTMGLSIGISLAIEGIMKLINKSSELKQKNEELQQSVQQNLKSNNDMIHYLQNEGKEYDTLSQKTKLTTEEQEKLKSIKQQLADKFPELVQGINSETGEMELQKKTTKELIELLKQKNQMESKKLIGGGNDFLKDKQKEYKDIQKEINTLQRQAQMLKDGGGNLDKNGIYYKHTIDGLNEIKRTVGLTTSQQEELNRKTEEHRNMLIKVSSKVDEQKQKYAELKPYIQAVYDTKNLDNFQQKLANTIIDPSKFIKNGKLDFTSLQVEIQQFKDKIEKDPNYSNIKMVASLKDPKEADLKKYFDSILNLSKTLKMSPLELTKIMPLKVDKEYLKKNSQIFVKILKSEIKKASGQDKIDLQDMIKMFDPKEITEQNNKNIRSLKYLNDKQEDVNKTYESSITTAKDYNKYMQEITENHHLSADSVNEINQKHSELIPLLGDEEGMYNYLKTASAKERDIALNAIGAKLAGNSTFCSNVMSQHKTAFDQIAQAYNVDLSNFETVATAKSKINTILCNRLKNDWLKVYGSIGGAITAVKAKTTRSFLDHKAGENDGGEYLGLKKDLEQLQGLNEGVTIIEKEIEDAKNRISKTTFNPVDFRGMGTRTGGGGSGKHSSGGKGTTGKKNNSSKSETQYKYDGKKESLYDAKIKTINNSLDKSDKLIETISQKIANLQSLESKSNFKDILAQENEKLDAQKAKLSHLQSAQSQAESMKNEIKQKFYSNWSTIKGRDLDALSETDWTNLYNSMYGKEINFGTGDGAKKREEAFKKGADLFKELRKNYEDASSLVLDTADKQLKIEQEINSTIKERYEVQEKMYSEELDKDSKHIQDTADILEIIQNTDEENYKKQGKWMYKLADQQEDYLYHVVRVRNEFIKQRNALEENSLAWNLLNQQVQGYSEKVIEANRNFIQQQKELKDLAETKVREILEKEHANKEKQLEKEVFKYTKEEWEKYQKDKVARIKKDIEEINKFIAENGQSQYTDDALLARQTELDMIQSKSFDNLKDYQQEFEDIHNMRIKAIDDEIDALNKKNEADKESEEREKRRIDLEKIRQQLENARNQKDIQQLTKDKNGLYQWTYVADEKKIDDLEDQLKKKQEENAKWEEDLEDKKKRKKLDDEKKFEEDLIKQKQEYNNVEKNKLDEHYSDMDKLTKNYMNDLKSTYGNKWDEIINVLEDKLSKAKQLNEQLSNIGSTSGSYSRDKAEKDFLDAKARGDEKGANSVRDKYNKSSSSSSRSSSRPKVSSHDESSFLKAKASGDSKTVNSIRKKYSSFDTGGYTGAWGKDGKLAILHEKELVLNQAQTEDILKSVELLQKYNPLANIKPPNVQLPNISELGITNKQPLTTQHIYKIDKLECPNVTNDDGVNYLFENLTRLGMQYNPEPSV